MVKLQACIRRYLHIQRLNHELLRILHNVGDSTLLPKQSKSYLSAHQLAAAKSIYAHIIQFIRKGRRRKSASRIQRWFRIWRLLRGNVEIWLRENKYCGLFFSRENGPAILELLSTLLHGSRWKERYISKSEKTLVTLSQVHRIRKHIVVLAGARYQQNKVVFQFHPRNYEERLPPTKICPKSTGSRCRHTCPAPGTSKILRWGSALQLKSLSCLRRRGHNFRTHELEAIEWCLEKKFLNFDRTSAALDFLEVNDMALLTDLIMLLCKQGSERKLKYYFENRVWGNAAATLIQSTFRSHRCRRHIGASLVLRVIALRAVILLQRWWRFQNGLQRHLTLLTRISSSCRSLDSTCVYMDAWTFYCLIRVEHLPELPNSLAFFPELRGCPFMLAHGRASFKCLRVDADSKGTPFCDASGDDLLFNSDLSVGDRCKPNEDDIWRPDSAQARPSPSNGSQDQGENKCLRPRFHGMGALGTIVDLDTLAAANRDHWKDKPFNPLLKVRFGPPTWVTWAPTTVRSGFDAVAARSEPQWALFNLLTINVKVTVERFSPPFTKAEEEMLRLHIPDTSDFSIKMVKLEFSSLAEARTRCAMVALATYDPILRNFAEMMNLRNVHQR